MILLDQGCLHIWSKLSWLFLELVDRDLAHHKRKVLSWGFHLAALRVQTHCNMGLVCQPELLGLNDVVNILVFADGVLWNRIFA